MLMYSYLCIKCFQIIEFCTQNMHIYKYKYIYFERLSDLLNVLNIYLIVY